MVNTKASKYRGIQQLEAGRWRIKVTVVNPVTSKRVARERVVLVNTAGQAVEARESLLRELQRELAKVVEKPVAEKLPAVDTQPVAEKQPAVDTRPVADTGPTTLADFAEQWLEGKARRVRPGVAEFYLDILGKRVLPVLGELRAQDLKRSDVDRWVAWAEAQVTSQGRQYSRDTLLGWWRVLGNFLRDVAAEVDIPDPMRRIRPPRSEERNVTEKRALSADQLQALLRSVEELYPTWYPEMLLMAFSGMRPSELYALRWDQVDLDAHVLRLTRSVHRGIVSPPKTGEPREVALTAGICATLRMHEEHLRRSKHPGLSSGLVFPSRAGTHRTPSSLHKILRLSAKAAGIPIKVGPKTLRRTFITLMALSGHDRLAIRANVGHCDEAMTERYAWVSVEEKRRLVQALEGLAASGGK